MKGIYLLISFFLLNESSSFAQQNMWDVPVTEILIDHNKKNYSDNISIKDNQFASTVTVSAWKEKKDEFKKLVDDIDKRLTSMFIVLADVTILYDIYQSFDDMMEYQQKTLALTYQYPFATSLVYQRQISIYEAGLELFAFVNLLVVSYQDISKMQVSSRNTIYRQLRDQIYVLKSSCYSLYLMMKKIEMAEKIQNTLPANFINKDKEIITDIINKFK